MATANPQVVLAPDLRSTLAGLRWRIRLYIWLEGLALAVIWVGLMFWVAFGLDYLPVLLGASEMPAAARGVILVTTGMVLAYILYHWILRRTFVRLGDRSMALLLERRFGGFHDSLVTAVEMSAIPDHASAFSRDLLGLTAKEARAGLGDVRYRQVFNNGSLLWKIALACLAAASVAIFFGTNAGAFERATERLLLLSDEPWPRSARIEVVGIEVLREAAPGESGPRTMSLPFENRVLKVAKGANVSLKVRAAHAPEAKFVPQQCTIYYRTKSGGQGVRGERGSVTMSNFRDAASVDAGIGKFELTADGTVISQFAPGGPAMRSELKEGDIVIGFNDEPIILRGELEAKLAACRPGDDVVFTIKRGGRSLSEPTVFAREKESIREKLAAIRGAGPREYVDVTVKLGSRPWRNFWFDGKPFKAVLSTVDFDVLGFDHRVSGYRLEVVDSPAVVETLLDVTYPKYMVDEATASHLPAAGLPYVPSGTSLPIGAQVTLRFKSNKKLKQAEIAIEGKDERKTIEASPESQDRFSYRIDALPGSITLNVSLIDTDNVSTERPFRVFLTAIEDQPPLVEVALKGIGSSVTPDVMVPFRGKVSDDYGVAKTWFDIQINDSGDPKDLAIGLGKGGAVEQTIDFRHERTEKTGLEIKPGDKLFLAVKAADKYDLPTAGGDTGEPHVAAGERYALDVVTPEQLLAQLEVREVGLRRRFEQILDELTQMRDSLLRVKASVSQVAGAGAEPEDLRGDNDPEGVQLTPEQKAQRIADFRLLRVQRAIQQAQKSLGEVLGVAAGFLDIREELINNRVDTEDRKKRLKDLIADPLNKTCAEQFPVLDQKLQVLETKLREAGVKLVLTEAAPLADDSIDQANLVLLQLEEVLARMQDLETYNELLEIVRDLLKDQQKLIERTQQERKRQTLEELK